MSSSSSAARSGFETFFSSLFLSRVFFNLSRLSLSLSLGHSLSLSPPIERPRKPTKKKDARTSFFFFFFFLLARARIKRREEKEEDFSEEKERRGKFYEVCSWREEENSLSSESRVLSTYFVLNYLVASDDAVFLERALLHASLSLSLSLLFFFLFFDWNQIFGQILREPERFEPPLADEFEQLVVAHDELLILWIHQILLLEVLPHFAR